MGLSLREEWWLIGMCRRKIYCPKFLIIGRWKRHGSETEHRNCFKGAWANCVSLTEGVPNQKTTRNINFIYSFWVKDFFKIQMKTMYFSLEKKKHSHFNLISHLLVYPRFRKKFDTEDLSHGGKFPGIFISLICQAVKYEESWAGELQVHTYRKYFV